MSWVDAKDEFSGMQTLLQAALGYASSRKKLVASIIVDARVALTAFQHVSHFCKYARLLVEESQEARLKSRLAQSCFGLDPFSLPVTKNHQFLQMDENAYRDWLVWIFEIFAERWGENGLLSIYKWLFDEESISRLDRVTANDLEGPVIKREEPVMHGNEGRRGRLDILIQFRKARLVRHIEVKVNSAESESPTFAKHDGYVKSLNENEEFRGYDIRHILLVTQAAQPNYPVESGVSFYPVTWRNLAYRLRHLAVSEEIPRLIGGVILLFCALIEQRLLGLTRDSRDQLQYLRQEGAEYGS